ncbi:MAG: hypothetical protein KDC07_02915 [Chitinophagaceae bacterium]|nr:hypothetical protein [Chitinophagaceae bacterium]MCB9044788.1 hypothetical protein [Chitinophagales bacterium]
MTEERILLTNGYRNLRHVLYIPVLIFAMDVINSGGKNAGMLAGLIISIGLYLLLLRARRLRFDQQNLYVIHGRAERTIHFSDIESIKKSRSKINGRRHWIVTYDDGTGKKRKLRYFPWDFGGVSKKLNAAVQSANPKVVIWDHPYFHQ